MESVVGMDANMHPTAFMLSGLQAKAQMQLVVAKGHAGTCRSKRGSTCIDFFAVSSRLAGGLA